MKKRVLFDTDVVLDFLLERQPFFSEATLAMNIISQGRAIAFISAHTVTTLFYILSSKLTQEKAKEIIGDLLKTISVAAVTDKIIQRALASKFRDFEDAVSHYAALEESVSMIVSRNIKDFAKSDIPVILPEIFISTTLEPVRCGGGDFS